MMNSLNFATSGQHTFCKYVERSQAKDITQPPSDKNNLFAARMTSSNPTTTPTHEHNGKKFLVLSILCVLFLSLLCLFS